MGNPGFWCLFGEFVLQSKSIFQGNFELATSCISFPWTFSWNIWRMSSFLSDLVVYLIARKNKSFNQTTPKPRQFRWKNSGVTRWQLSVLVDGFNIISTDMEIFRLLQRKNDNKKRWNHLHAEKLTPEKLCLEVYLPFEMVPFQGKCFVISEWWLNGDSEILGLLNVLGKSEKYSAQWWFNGDESHCKIRENHELNKSKLTNHLHPLIITIDWYLVL